MISIKTNIVKISTPLLLGIFLVASQGCLIEEPAIILTKLVQHSHHNGSPHESDSKTQGHHNGGNQDHENEGFDFCCDTMFSVIVKYSQFISCQSAQHFNPLVLHLRDFLSDQDLIKNTFFSEFSRPPCFRNRDIYALSSLLHAPPFA